MSSLVSLTDAQKTSLVDRVRRSGEARVVRRAQVLLLLADEIRVSDVAETIRVARSTIYRWVERFKSEGEAWLERCDSGRPAYTVYGSFDETLLDLVKQPPSHYDYLRSSWTSEMLAQTLSEALGRPVHASTVRRALPKLKVRWRRARPTLHIRHPDSAARIEAIETRLATAEPRVEVFYIDEADIDLNPKIGFSWSLAGHQTAIPTPGKNQKRYLAGALHARTGRVEYVEGHRKDTDLFLNLLEHLRRTYRRARRIILIADNYIIHKSNLAKVWLAQNPKFEILFQPAYQPWINDIEKLWKQLHDNVTRNHRHPNIDKLMDAVRYFMRVASPFPGSNPSVARFGSAI